MSNSFFQFKQFTVWHDRCAMKVGTDGVLLGAWTPVIDARRILDVGTGTGVVALMLAQRSSALIIGIDIDEPAVFQARENVARSPWKERIEVFQTDFKNFMPTEKFDVVVSNPPYFSDSLRCPDSQRSFARHTDSLTYDELLKGVVQILSEDGKFTLVLPAEMTDKVKILAQTYGLFPTDELRVRTKPDGEIRRVLISFSLVECDSRVKELLTEVERHRYSDEYIALTKAYYLKM